MTDTLADALNDLDDLLSGLPAAEIERRRSMQVQQKQEVSSTPAPAPNPFADDPPAAAPAPAPVEPEVEVKKPEELKPAPPEPAVSQEPTASKEGDGEAAKPVSGVFGSDFLFSLQTGMAREEIQEPAENVRQLSPRSLLRSFTFGGDENAELERVERKSVIVNQDQAAAATASSSTSAAPARSASPLPSSSADEAASNAALSGSSSRTTISKPPQESAAAPPASLSAAAPATSTAAPIAPEEPQARERLATMRQTMSAALVGLDAALQGLTVKGPSSPKPAPAPTTQAPVRPEMSPTSSDVRSKVDDEMRKIEEAARQKFEEEKRKRDEEKEQRRKETGISSPPRYAAKETTGAGTEQDLQALRSRVHTAATHQPATAPEVVRYDNASDYKRQMLEKYELEQLERNELLRKKKEGMQLQLQQRFNMVKKLKVDPEETFICMCYHEGKVIAGTREGSLVVIDIKSQEVVEHKQKVHTGMVNVITSVGSIHLWSASDDGCINVWERKTRSAAGAKDRQAQKDNSYKPAQGLLTKQGVKVKNWKVRWFVLEEESLHYYEKKDDKVPKGSINLVGAKLEKLAAKDKKFHFSVTPAKGGRTYFIYAANEEERENWVQHIGSAIKATEEV